MTDVRYFIDAVGGRAVGVIAIFGYGIGMGEGEGGTGVRHTSGNPKFMPDMEQFANINTPLLINLCDYKNRDKRLSFYPI